MTRSIDTSKILKDLYHQGYSAISIDPKLWNPAIAVSKQLFSVKEEELLSGKVSLSTGVLGYYPPSIDERYDISNKKRHISYYYLTEKNLLIGDNPILKSNGNFKDSTLNKNIEATYQQISKLGIDISSSIFMALRPEAPSPFINNNRCLSLMRLLKYPGSNATYQSKYHTDYEFLTFIYTDQEGLESMDQQKKWNSLAAPKYQLIIQAGDMIEAISHGKIKSPIHRVRIQSKTRYSTIYFQGLPIDHPIEYKLEGYQLAGTYGQHIYPLLTKSAPHLKSTEKAILSQLNCSPMEKNPYKLAKY